MSILKRRPKLRQFSVAEGELAAGKWHARILIAIDDGDGEAANVALAEALEAGFKLDFLYGMVARHYVALLNKHQPWWKLTFKQRLLAVAEEDSHRPAQDG